VRWEFLCGIQLCLAVALRRTEGNLIKAFLSIVGKDNFLEIFIGFLPSFEPFSIPFIVIIL
jgi:hypothetical protein